MNDKTNVLVIGAPRSGTTLLSGLLSANKSATTMLPECTYITQIIQHFHDFLHYSDLQRFATYAISEQALTKTYRGMVDSMLDTVKSHFIDTDYRYLILKDPELTQLVDLIPCFFGNDSKTVCVVRDPRAVIASMLNVENKKKKDLWLAFRKKPNWVTTNVLVNQIFRIKRLIPDFFPYYWIVQESQLNKRGAVHVVRYEKIVAREEGEFERLEEYLGFAVNRDGFGKVHFDFDRTDPTYSAGYGKEIRVTNSDFRKSLTNRQIKQIEILFSDINTIYRWW